MTRRRYLAGIGLSLCLAAVVALMTAGCGPKQTPSSATGTATPSAAQTAQQTPSTAPSSLPAGQALSGTIASIAAETMALTTERGLEAVEIASSALIEKTVVCTLADLSPGQFLTVTGATDASGNVAATLISVRQSGQLGRGGFISDGTSPYTGTSPPRTVTGTATNTSLPGTELPDGGVFAGRGTAGTLASIRGSTLVVTTLQSPSTQVTVTTSSSTVIEKTVTGTLADLTVGAYVTVFGQPDSSGVIVATTVMILPAGRSNRFMTPGD